MQAALRAQPAACAASPVQEDLSFSDVAAIRRFNGDDARELIDEISLALRELAEDDPEAAELLRGRTLARSFH